MVLRDRNHPSIILWSTGNEIIERDGRSEGYACARMLADYIRSLDNTRAVTNALCGTWDNPLFSPAGIDTAAVPEGFDYWGKVTEKFAEPLDVAGYNYLLNRYESDGKKVSRPYYLRYRDIPQGCFRVLGRCRTFALRHRRFCMDRY